MTEGKFFLGGSQGPLSRHVGAPAVVVVGGGAERTQALVKITSERGISIRAVVGKTLLEAKVCEAPALSHLSLSAVALATSGRNEHGVPGPCPHRNHPLARGQCKLPEEETRS